MHVALCCRFASPFWVARGDMPAILSICLSVRSCYKTSVGDGAYECGHVAHIDNAVAVDVAHGVAVACRAQQFVDECGHVAHVDRAVAVDVAFTLRAKDVDIYRFGGACNSSGQLEVGPAHAY